MTDYRTPASGIEIRSNGASNGHGNGRSELRPAVTLQSPPALPALPGRGTGLLLIAIAAILGAGAVALGIGAFVHQRHHHAARPRRTAPVDATAPLKKAVALLASPQSERVPLAGSVGRLVLVVDDHGDGLLVVRNLGVAPAGRAYQAWVIPPGASAAPAARFGGGDRVVLLGRRVVQGARVAVTLERAGVREPTRQLRLVARRPL